MASANKRSLSASELVAASTNARFDESNASPLLCAGCDYDLQSISETGKCPECALPVDESIRVIGGWTRPRLIALRRTILAYSIGVVTWAGFGVALMNSATPATRTFAAAVLTVHAACIIFAAMVGTYASSRQRKPVRVAIVWGLSMLVLASGFFVVLAALRVVPVASNAVKVYFVIAALTRVTLIAFASWWLIGARYSFMQGSTTLGKLSIVALVGIGAVWLTFGVALGGGYLWSTWLWERVELLGAVTVALDPIATLFICVVALSMLGTIKTRLRTLKTPK